MEKNMNIHSVKAINITKVRTITCKNDHTTTFVYDVNIVGNDDEFTITVFSEEDETVDINIGDYSNIGKLAWKKTTD